MAAQFMIKPDTTRRSNRSEIMDDFELQGSALRKTLKDLENINKWLGGNRVTRNGLKKLLNNSEKGKKIKIADIGCGNGAILRNLSRWAAKNNYNLEFTGVDANEHAIQIARELSVSYPDISFLNLNIFSDEFRKMKFDIILCTLTLHHFKNAEILDIVNQFYLQAEKGVIINDLHRSRMAYHLFQAFCSVFVNNEIARKDGLTSILRGFRKSDIREFSEEIPAKVHSIEWKWAFRYQWIIKKEHHL